MSEHERKKKKAAVQSDRPEKEKEHLIKKKFKFSSAREGDMWAGLGWTR